MVKVLIDADTGIDDSIAILYALKNPKVRVVAISTACGNTDALQAAENTIRLIKLAQPAYPVPVAVGANKPLKGDWGGPVPHIHGDNGIGNVLLPPSEQKAVNEDAVDLILRLSRENAGELVLVALGRLTNIALAFRKDPELPRRIKKIVMMGGTVYAPGNASPVAEANIAGDPEAADLVFTAGFDITMVGLDVTMKTRLTMEQIDRLERYCKPSCRPVVDYMREALEFYMNFNRIQNNCMDDCPVHDPLAMLVAVDPSLVMTRRMKARVECGGDYCRGMVVTDLREHPFEAEFVEICLEVDGTKAVNALLSVFCRER